MCKLLRVSRSGFYAWLKHEASAREKADAELLEKIERVHAESRGIYGAPRVHEMLIREGVQCGRKRISRLMRSKGLRGKAPKRFRVRTTDSNHDDPIAENLLNREFETKSPNEAWVSDITYIRTGEGWLYLACVMDLFSRRVVGWSMATHMETSLVLSALTMALGARDVGEGLILHSDRGSQYASKEYRSALARHGIRQSMSRAGDCYDNAVQESFFHTLKTECGDWFATKEAARAAVFDYIATFYNPRRLHSSLGYMSPDECEAAEVTSAA